MIAPALAGPKLRETEYRCPCCGWWLFSSTATWGKVVTKCDNRRCQTCQKGNCAWRGAVYLTDVQHDKESVLD